MSTKHPAVRRHSFSMVELIFALGLLMVLSMCFVKSVQTLKDMNRLFILENRAILVLDNTVERLSTEPRITANDVKAVFRDEYSKSCLVDETELMPACKLECDKVRLQFIKANGKPIAEITLKCEKKK